METAFSDAWRSAVGESPAIEASAFYLLVAKVEEYLSRNMKKDSLNSEANNNSRLTEVLSKDEILKSRIEKSISSHTSLSFELPYDLISRKSAEALIQNILSDKQLNEPKSSLVYVNSYNVDQQMDDFVSRSTSIAKFIEPEFIVSDCSDAESLMDLRANSPSIYEEEGLGTHQFFLRELLNDIYKRHLKIKTLFSKSELQLIDMDQQSKAELKWLKELSERNKKMLSEVEKVKLALKNIARDLGMEDRLDEHISERTKPIQKNCINSILAREKLSHKIIISNDNWDQEKIGSLGSGSKSKSSKPACEQWKNGKPQKIEDRNSQDYPGDVNKEKKYIKQTEDLKVENLDNHVENARNGCKIGDVHVHNTSTNFKDDESDALIILAIIIAFTAFFGPIILTYGSRETM